MDELKVSYFWSQKFLEKFGVHPELGHLHYKPDQRSEEKDKATVMAGWTLTPLLVTYAVALDTNKMLAECRKWACDFAIVYDWLIRQYYIFVAMELETHRIVHVGATKFPIDKWTSQQLREATPRGRGQKYLIRDSFRPSTPAFNNASCSSLSIDFCL